MASFLFSHTILNLCLSVFCLQRYNHAIVSVKVNIEPFPQALCMTYMACIAGVPDIAFSTAR